MQEAGLILLKEGFKTMLLLATYENQLTAYHFNKNIRTYIFFTTLLINIILSEREQEIKCFPKNIMVSSKG